MIHNKLLLNRTLSSFGVSIPTGLMLESLFTPTATRYDNDRTVPSEVHIDKYSKHYINIYTLTRNVINAASIPKDKLNSLLRSRELLDVVIDEINIISELYNDSKCELVIYIPSYKKAFIEYGKNKDELAISLNHDIISYVDSFIKKNDYSVGANIASGEKLPSTHDKVLITTHISYDLLNYRQIPNLELLESHTGKLKNKSLWYTKYHKIGKLDMSFFPYTAELVYILGDGVVSLPMKLSIRRELHELAIASKWTHRTNDLIVRNKLLDNKTFKPLLVGVKI